MEVCFPWWACVNLYRSVKPGPGGGHARSCSDSLCSQPTQFTAPSVSDGGVSLFDSFLSAFFFFFKTFQNNVPIPRYSALPLGCYFIPHSIFPTS